MSELEYERQLHQILTANACFMTLLRMVRACNLPDWLVGQGVRLLHDDNLLIVAPYGLTDLFNLILRRNPRRVSLEQFQKRVQEKQILEKWPKVRLYAEN